MTQILSNHKGKLISLALFFSFILLLPIAVKYIIVSSIKGQGFEQVNVDNVDINLFTGKASIDKLSINKQQQQKFKLGKLELEYDFSGIFTGGVTIKRVTLVDAYLKVIMNDKGDLEVVIPIETNNEGIAASEGSDEAEPAQHAAVSLPKIDAELISLTNVDIDIDIPNYQGHLSISRFELKQATTWQDQQTSLLIGAALNDAPLNINVTAQLFDSQPTVNGSLEFSAMQLADFNKFLPQNIAMNSAELGGKIIFTGQKTASDKVSSSADLLLTLDNLDVTYQPIELKLAKFNLTSLIEFSLEENVPAFSTESNLVLNALKISDAEQNFVLLATDDLTVADASFDNTFVAEIGSVSSNSLAINMTPVMPDGMIAVEQLTVAGIQYQQSEESKLDIASVEISKLIDHVHLGVEYELLGFENLEKTLASLATPTTSAESTAEPIESMPEEDSDKALQINVKEVLITNDSKVILTKDFDKSSIIREYIIEELRVSNLQPGMADNESQFILRAKPDEFADINIQGTGQLFATPLVITSAGTLEGMSLSKLSPFAEPALGYQLQNGQLDHKFDLSLADNKLDMKNHIVVRKLEFKELEDHHENSEHASGLPIPMAISLLEDSDGKIELDVPIKSDLNNTEVQLSNVIRTSLATVVQKSSLSLLKYSLQPFGAILLATELVVDQVNTINFQPLVFELNSVTPIAEQQEYPQKLAKLLLDKEDMVLNLCGFSNAQDKAQLTLLLTKQLAQSAPSSEGKSVLDAHDNRAIETLTSQEGTSQTSESVLNESVVSDEELSKSLEALADSRSKYLKTLLVEQGVKGSRLFVCKPQYLDKAISGVTIGM